MNSSIVIPHQKALCQMRRKGLAEKVVMLDTRYGQAIQLLGTCGEGKQCCGKCDK